MKYRGVLGVGLLMFCSLLDAAEVDGSLQWARKVAMSTVMSGVIEEVLVQPGQQVKKGQLLLRLEQQVIRARLEQAKTRLEALKLELEEAERELTRAEELYERTVLSDTELMAARLDHSATLAEHRQARAQLAQSQYELSYSEIRAPFDAVILERQAEIGQVVVTAMRAPDLLVVAEEGKMSAQAYVDVSQLIKLELGDEIKVEVNGRLYPARIDQLGIEPEAQLGYPLRASFEYRGKPLGLGQGVTLLLP